MNEQWPLMGFGIELAPITANKLEKIRAWRNHPDIAEFMKDKSIISAAQQQAWFVSLAENKQQVYLMISYKGEDIGVIYATTCVVDNSTVYANTNDEASTDVTPLDLAIVINPGLYIAPNCKYKNSVLAFSPSLVFIEYLFKQGRCNYLQAQVFKHNNSAIRYNEMLGYQQDEMNEHGLVTMKLSLENFTLAKAKLSKILRFK